MLSMHKEIMLEFIRKDSQKEERMRKMIQDILDLTRQNNLLQAENQRLREMLLGNYSREG